MIPWEALKTMRERQAKALPITEDGNRLSGIISLGDIAIANMDGMEDGALAKAGTPLAQERVDSAAMELKEIVGVMKRFFPKERRKEK